MKILTANRLSSGEVVWYGHGGWVDRIDAAQVAADAEAAARLEAIGKAAFARNEVLDVELIDVAVIDGAIQPKRLRERIRAAGPTIRNDLGKQARSALTQAA